MLIGPDMGSPHDLTYEDLLGAGEPIVPDEPEEDDPVVLMYTGGTTGLPKGVLLDQRAELLTRTPPICTRRRCSTPRRWAAEAFRGGWYHTGDAGYVDHEGFVHLVDRVKDMIVTGGEHVYSTEVEDALASHPAVEPAAVIGIPAEESGEAVHAVVVVKADLSVDVEELIAHARERIAGYKVPKSIDLRHDPLPLSGAMKVLKRELREPFWKGHDRGVG